MSRISLFSDKEVSRSLYWPSRSRTSNLTAFILNVQKEWLIKVKFFDRITPRIFHSYYMAHTLRDAIIETKLCNFRQ